MVKWVIVILIYSMFLTPLCFAGDLFDRFFPSCVGVSENNNKIGLHGFVGVLVEYREASSKSAARTKIINHYGFTGDEVTDLDKFLDKLDSASGDAQASIFLWRFHNIACLQEETCWYTTKEEFWVRMNR